MPSKTSTQAETLQDYNIRLTGGAQDQQTSTASTSRNSEQQPVTNPQGWPDDYRQVPPHRPVNTHLNMEERPMGSHPVENVFITHMFTGVWIQSVSADQCTLRNTIF